MREKRKQQWQQQQQKVREHFKIKENNREMSSKDCDDSSLDHRSAEKSLKDIIRQLKI